MMISLKHCFVTQNRASLNSRYSVCVNDTEIPFSEIAQNLCVIIDSELSMETHISADVNLLSTF